MKLALALFVFISLAGSPGTYAEDIGHLSISGQVVESGFAATATPDSQRAVQRGTSIQVVTLPGDERRKVVITAWD